MGASDRSAGPSSSRNSEWGWSEKLAKAGILVKLGLSPSLDLWYFWLSHKCSESSQGRQMFQSPCPDLGAQAALASKLSIFSAKALSNQQHQLLLAFVNLFEVVNELGKLQVTILGQ